MKINISRGDVLKFQHLLLSWGRENFAEFPWRISRSPFHSLIAELLLQRTKAEQVKPVYIQFKRRFRSIKSLAMSSEEEVKKIIGSLGLHWRARWIHKLGVHLHTKNNSRIPEEQEELERLPGVGPYAAGAYLSLHRNVRAAILDSNVIRLYSRYFGFNAGPETRREKWLSEFAKKITPEKDFKIFNYALLDFTRLICKPKPLCQDCFFKNKCNYYKSKNNEGETNDTKK